MSLTSSIHILSPKQQNLGISNSCERILVSCAKSASKGYVSVAVPSFLPSIRFEYNSPQKTFHSPPTFSMRFLFPSAHTSIIGNNAWNNFPSTRLPVCGTNLEIFHSRKYTFSTTIRQLSHCQTSAQHSSFSVIWRCFSQNLTLFKS